jgi:hypothetical protein
MRRKDGFETDQAVLGIERLDFGAECSNPSRFRAPLALNPAIKVITEIENLAPFNESRPGPAAGMHGERFHGEAGVTSRVFPIHSAVGKDDDANGCFGVHIVCNHIHYKNTLEYRYCNSIGEPVE